MLKLTPARAHLRWHTSDRLIYTSEPLRYAVFYSQWEQPEFNSLGTVTPAKCFFDLGPTTDGEENPATPSAPPGSVSAKWLQL